MFADFTYLFPVNLFFWQLKTYFVLVVFVFGYSLLVRISIIQMYVHIDLIPSLVLVS
jgi:hypothetical protein